MSLEDEKFPGIGLRIGRQTIDNIIVADPVAGEDVSAVMYYCWRLHLTTRKTVIVSFNNTLISFSTTTPGANP